MRGRFAAAGGRGAAARAWAVLLASLMLASCAVFMLAAPARLDAAVLDTDAVGAIVLADNAAVKAAAPDLSCRQGGLMTADGKVLWSRDANAQVPMASTTKIMTAVVALEVGELDDVITVSKQAVDTEGKAAQLAEGDQLTLDQMLYAMLLPSDNDAAVAIAEHYGDGNVEAFVGLMNEKAEALGMEDTHYSNPSGVIDDDNYTTVTDYLQLARYAMQNETFKTIVATPEYTFESAGNGGRQVTVRNSNALLGQYEGMLGIKTGFTDDAGYCFVGACKRGDVELYTVVFGAPDDWMRFADTAVLLDWGFAHYHSAELIETGQQVGKAVATDWPDKTVPVVVEQAPTAFVFDYDPDLTTQVEITDRAGTIEAGANMGTMSWLQGDELVATTPLVAGKTVHAPGLFDRVQILWGMFASFFTGDHYACEQSIDAPATYPLISAVVS